MSTIAWTVRGSSTAAGRIKFMAHHYDEGAGMDAAKDCAYAQQATPNSGHVGLGGELGGLYSQQDAYQSLQQAHAQAAYYRSVGIAQGGNEDIDLCPEWRIELRGRAGKATTVSLPRNHGSREAALKAAREWIDSELLRLADLRKNGPSQQ